MQQEHIGAREIPADLAVIGAKLVNHGLIEITHHYSSR
jgi:hypothetical protein